MDCPWKLTYLFSMITKASLIVNEFPCAEEVKQLPEAPEAEARIPVTHNYAANTL